MADASRSVAGLRSRGGGWYGGGGRDERYESHFLPPMVEEVWRDRGVGRVASRAGAKSVSRAASLKPCEARRRWTEIR